MRHRQKVKLTRAIQATARSVVILAVLTATVFLVRKHVRRSEEPSVSQQQTVQQSEQVAKAPAPPPMAMTVDLAQFSPTRSEAPSASARRITLPAKRARITFLMPIGAEPGEYLVRLVKSNKETHIDMRAMGTTKDGVTSFDVDLQLEKLSQSRLQLMIRPPGLIWRTYPVFVE
jgi:hypothetical protein